MNCSNHSFCLTLSLFSVPFFSFLLEDEQPVISTGMAFPSMIMNISSQDRLTSSQVFHLVCPSAPLLQSTVEASYINVCWTVIGEMDFSSHCVCACVFITIYIFINIYIYLVQDHAMAIMAWSWTRSCHGSRSCHGNNYYFRDYRDYCIKM